MTRSLGDRLLILFTLEIGLLLGVLDLAGPPLGDRLPAVTLASLLVVGGAALVVALLLPRFADRSSTVVRAMGLFLVATSAACWLGGARDSTVNTMIACLGVILLATGAGLQSARAPPPPP
jgi:hypothetical protein